MTESTFSKTPQQDILVSVCCAFLPQTPESFARIRQAAGNIAAEFRFWEVVLIVDESSHDAYMDLLKDIANLRLFMVRDAVDPYTRRVIAASEAIGDTVLLVGGHDFGKLDLVDMVRRATDNSMAVLGRYERIGRIDRAMSLPLIALGRGAGFKVSLHDMQTIALPRTMLNQILGHPSREIAMRFPPLNGRFPLTFVNSDGSQYGKAQGDIRQRLALLHKLLVNLAPRMLHLVSLSALLSAVLGLCYTFYVIGAWLILPTLEPGWFTLSLAFSLIGTFLGVAIFGLSLGLQHLLTRVENRSLDDEVHEINHVDLFGQVASDLNVEVIGATGRKTGRDG